MSNRKWNLSIVMLFAIFATLMLSFLFSMLRIRDMIEPLRSTSNNTDPIRRHVVLISQELDNPYWRSIEEGAREAAKKFDINLEYSGPFRINPDEQITLFKKAIATKADAILIQGINNPIYRSLIETARNQGIPVITIDTDEPTSSRLSYVGTDNFEAGKRMGELVVQATGTKASIGVLIGNESADNQQQRLEGFRSVINKVERFTIVDVRSSNISRLQAADQAETILTNHPEVRYMVGLSSLDGLGILDATQRANLQDIHIFAFDDLEETQQEIAQCKIETTIVQQPNRMGYDAISLIHDFFQNKTIQPHHFTEITILNRDSSGVNNGVRCP